MSTSLDNTPADVTPDPADHPAAARSGPAGRRALAVGVVLVIGAVAFGLGTASTGHPAAPTNRTPAVCLTALDDAERVVALAHDAMGVEADAMGAAGRLDADGIDEQTAKLAAMTPQVQDAVNAYNTAAAACRSAGSAS
jgi:hypothetical protein